MNDLIERLEKATGPDRQLDRDIGIAALDWKPVRMYGHDMLDIPGHGHESDQPGGTYPALTESVDDAMALIPWNFPYALRAINVEGEMEYGACIDYGPWRESTVNLAIAICKAALRAIAIADQRPEEK